MARSIVQGHEGPLQVDLFARRFTATTSAGGRDASFRPGAARRVVRTIADRLERRVCESNEPPAVTNTTVGDSGRCAGGAVLGERFGCGG